jgi:hypothetical protein
MPGRETVRNGGAAAPPAAPDRIPPGAGAGLKACPSAPCIEGALLLGVMTETGRLSYVQPPTHIDAAFVARAQADGRPESRFRFSAPCIEAGCSQWTGSACAVAERVVEQDGTGDPPPRLPPCAIRRTCRWFFQRGADACAVCPRVMADCGGTETYRSTLGAADAGA